MSVTSPLQERSGNLCELCKSEDQLTEFIVPPTNGTDISERIVVCGKCNSEINEVESLDVTHWRCLNDAMWSQEPGVQVMANVMLKRLSGEAWARDLLNMMYMDEETEKWAGSASNVLANKVIHKDSNGNVLFQGDTVTLIKDLNVKGGGFTAKRGTTVKGIKLDPGNANHIEGKVNDQHIVILTQYVRKMN